uniref:Uncharacterized protein n=1 Tax=Pristionchus pacificus TaxID=54126 RepID=A0A2A6D2V9_PRIPA|eukprot:PDM84676.1 hypothetical protein PRIPAC_33699 [Pristionchus pacificus]
MTILRAAQLSNGPSNYLNNVTCNDLYREPDEGVSSPIYEVIAFPVSNHLSYALAGLQSHLLLRNRRKMDNLTRKLAMMRAEKARAIREEMEYDVSSSGARSIRRREQ